ncbi:MAG TPA: hypothetical protein VGS19_16810 [Streptosporangiaceae bacterium]|nr:hypothetical protein [Streptosporangiaceae bacterium]
MIVRILGEGQLNIDEAACDEINDLDATLEKAVSAGDETAFHPALEALLERVRALGTPVAADSLASSDLILPHSDASLADVRALLSENGHESS